MNHYSYVAKYSTQIVVDGSGYRYTALKPLQGITMANSAKEALDQVVESVKADGGVIRYFDLFDVSKDGELLGLVMRVRPGDGDKEININEAKIPFLPAPKEEVEEEKEPNEDKPSLMDGATKYTPRKFSNVTPKGANP